MLRDEFARRKDSSARGARPCAVIRFVLGRDERRAPPFQLCSTSSFTMMLLDLACHALEDAQAWDHESALLAFPLGLAGLGSVAAEGELAESEFFLAGDVAAEAFGLGAHSQEWLCH